jgi:hypothetical protein
MTDMREETCCRRLLKATWGRPKNFRKCLDPKYRADFDEWRVITRLCGSPARHKESRSVVTWSEDCTCDQPALLPDRQSKESDVDQCQSLRLQPGL